MASGSTSLFLVRHAHAGDPEQWHADDTLRPLSAKGRQQADRLARHLAALDVRVDAILTSPKVRARETAEPIGGALGIPVRVEDRIVGVTVRSFEQILADAGDPKAVMIVGHDPEFSRLAADLSGASDLPMRKGALARFDARRPLREGTATLRWLLPPDALVDGTPD